MLKINVLLKLKLSKSHSLIAKCSFKWSYFRVSSTDVKIEPYNVIGGSFLQ